jgi:hypothetical protein
MTFALTFDQIRTYFESRLGVSLPARETLAVRCPFHDDRTASATVFLSGNGGFNCHGCPAKGNTFQFEMLFSKCTIEEAKRNVADLTGVQVDAGGSKGRCVAVYDYRHDDGSIAFQKRRYERPDGKKFFSIHRPDGRDGWQPGLDEPQKTRKALYNLPNLITANLVLLPEGEKDCDTLNRSNLFPDKPDLRVAATTNSEGAWKPGDSPKWMEHYSPYFAGKHVVIFEDNDDSGRTWADYVSGHIFRFASSVRRISFPDLPEKGDVTDWMDNHTEKDLRKLITSAPKWTPPAIGIQPPTTPDNAAWASEGMDDFLKATDAEIGWIVQNVLAPGRLTQMFAPRGLGKSLLAEHWAVEAARRGLRVLILDRDNSRQTLQKRLRSFDAEGLKSLRVVSREKCSPLTKPEAWAKFPYADYDLVIVDSLDSMAEGVGEQDSSKPAKAMAPLLDICHREDGPAVLLLGNTIKSATHSRGSGVVEDRADIVFELRDGTDFKPTGSKPWIEELPAQGAAEWLARSARRKGRTTYRLALVATKFRDGEEPAARMLEISTADHPWSVTDVTADIDAHGEAERLRMVEEKRAMRQAGVARLLVEIERRAAIGQSPLLKAEAETFLKAAGYTRKDARTIIAEECFEAIPGPGKGHPSELHRKKVEGAAEMRQCSDLNKNADSQQAYFRRPHQEHAAEIDLSQTRMNTGYLQQAISADDTPLTHGMSLGAEPEGASGQGPFFDLEV